MTTPSNCRQETQAFRAERPNQRPAAPSLAIPSAALLALHQLGHLHWRSPVVSASTHLAQCCPLGVFVSLIPSGVPESHRPIAVEADRIHESALWSAQGQFEQAKLWRLINLALGVPAAALAAISGGTALAGDVGVWPGILALAAAAFSATLTTVNASRRMTQAQASANAYLQLQTAARQFLTIDLVGMGYEEARDTLRNLTNTRDELNKTADPPGRLAYKLAGRNIEGGGQSYAADEGG